MMIRLLLGAILSLTLTTTAHGEQKKVFGDYEVHYSVVNTGFLKPEVARRYDVTRAGNRALVNIAVRKRENGGTRAQKAVVKGRSSNLMQKEPLEFREITEQDAIYYIADFQFDNDEVRKFRIDVQPDVNRPPYVIEFSQRFYVD